jgi:hypothetical protein
MKIVCNFVSFGRTSYMCWETYSEIHCITSTFLDTVTDAKYTYHAMKLEYKCVALYHFWCSKNIYICPVMLYIEGFGLKSHETANFSE